MFCVYLHKKKTTGQTFYVGKGIASRPYTQNGRSKLWRRTIAKHGLEVVVLKSGMSEPCAFAYERAIIAAIGRDNLYNLTDGGEGASGRVPSEAQRRRCSIANKGTKPARHTIEMASQKNSKPIGTRCGLRFSSATAAAKALRPDNWRAAKVSISSCAKGNTKHSYGYEWGYIKNDEPEFLYVNRMSEPRPKRWRAVRCSNGVHFDAISHAVDWLRVSGWPKANTGALCRAAKVNGIAYGLGWSYAP